MSSEREDEFLSWRGRLDSPEGIPGQGLDHREQTWERLKGRLGGTTGQRFTGGFREPGLRRLTDGFFGRRLSMVDRFRGGNKRRLLAYGIAAACLVLLLVPASRLFQHRATTAGRGSVRQPALSGAHPVEGEEVIRSVGPTVPMASPTTPPGAAARVDDPAGGRSQKAGGRRSRVIEPMQLKTVAVTDDTIHMLEAPAAPLVSRVAPAMPPPQRKWKVVDLSDLQGSLQTPHGMATNRPFLPLRISFGNTDPPDGGSGGASSTGNSGIKIKFYTSN